MAYCRISPALLCVLYNFLFDTKVKRLHFPACGPGISTFLNTHTPQHHFNPRGAVSHVKMKSISQPQWYARHTLTHTHSTCTNCWDKEHKTHRWCTLYASIGWADQRESLGPCVGSNGATGGCVVLGGRGQPTLLRRIRCIMATWRNFQNSVVVVSCAN